MSKKTKEKSVSIKLLKKRFQEWYLSHPDVLMTANIEREQITDEGFRGLIVSHICPLWFIQNLMADLISYQESPIDWIKEIEKEKQSK